MKWFRRHKFWHEYYKQGCKDAENRALFAEKELYKAWDCIAQQQKGINRLVRKIKRLRE